MRTSFRSKIAGTGCYIPTERIRNDDFLRHEFYAEDGTRIPQSNEDIIKKFESITGINERRHVTDDLVASDIAFRAAQDALESSRVDKESLDYIIVAHNFGDVSAQNRRTDLLPSLAARVKHLLEIDNPAVVAYDLPFGCPGWLQGLIQSDYYIRSGDAKRTLVIGAETLSRVSDPHDRDSMIYSDGAGATVLEAIESDAPVGILAHAARSDTRTNAFLLWMDRSYGPAPDQDLMLKMHGHKLYEYALKTVPLLVKQCLAKAEISVKQVSKILIHQANQKMDEAIVQRVFRLCGEKTMPENVMPMTISWLGNSSVATLPTLLDLILKGRLDGHSLTSGEIIVFASVGAGMNVNAMVYKFE
ncbi:MAG: ketoacyl-ACP synthase III [Vicinamibacteria bacterium]|nr:ketoacyl-ACP synthase III [Vicinamibacteria bacterium]